MKTIMDLPDVGEEVKCDEAREKLTRTSVIVAEMLYIITDNRNN